MSGANNSPSPAVTAATAHAATNEGSNHNNGSGTHAAASPHTSIIGDCRIALLHQTTYEPPLYLFPELLDKVPQGSPPATAWDAVADAVDIAGSYWRLADPSTILSTTAAAASSSSSSGGGGDGSVAAVGSAGPYGTEATTAGGRALSSLAAMIAANRLLPAGFTADTLGSSAFSAAAVIAELHKLQQRAGLAPPSDTAEGTAPPASSSSSSAAAEQEGSLLMTNHFINLLAWKKLREVNHPAAGSGRSVATATTGHEVSSSGSAASKTQQRQRGRARGAKAERDQSDESEVDDDNGNDDEGERVVDGDILAHMQASPDPWSTEIDERRYAGRFIAGRETDVEGKVKLLHTLSRLYERPVKRLRSQGVQTDHVVPAGTVNVTSPFADPFRSGAAGARGGATGAASLSCAADLGWGGGAVAADAKATQRCTMVAGAADYAVVVSSLDAAQSAKGGGAPQQQQQQRVPSRRLDLMSRTTMFGRTAGPQSDSRTGPLNVAVGLGAHAQQQQQQHLSALHFALMLKPLFGEEEDDQGEDKNDNGGDDDDDDCDVSERVGRLHHKTPTGFAVYLANYGRNGVRVITASSNNDASGSRGRSRWVLGDVSRVFPEDQMVVGGDVVVRLVRASGEDDDDDASGGGAKREGPATAADGSQVKVETEDE